MRFLNFQTARLREGRVEEPVLVVAVRHRLAKTDAIIEEAAVVGGGDGGGGEVGLLGDCAGKEEEGEEQGEEEEGEEGGWSGGISPHGPGGSTAGTVGWCWLCWCWCSACCCCSAAGWAAAAAAS